MTDRERIDALLDELSTVYAERALLAQNVLLHRRAAEEHFAHDHGAVPLPQVEAAP